MGVMTVTVPGPVKEWIEDQVGEDGGFATAGDYLSELVRRDQERRLDELRRIVDEGLASGVSKRTVREIFSEAVEKARARGTCVTR